MALANSGKGYPEPRQLATYDLPTLSSKVTSFAMVCRADPAPCTSFLSSPGDEERQSSSKPEADPPTLYSDPEKRIIVVQIQVTHRRKRLIGADRHEEENYTLFLHSDAFFKVLGSGDGENLPLSEGPPKHFEWNDYSRYARLTGLSSRRNYGKQLQHGSLCAAADWHLFTVCFVHGQRFVDYEEHPYGNKLHIWDFNPYAVRRKDYLDMEMLRESQGGVKRKEIFNEGGSKSNLTVSCALLIVLLHQ